MDNAKDLNVVIAMFNLIGQNGNLWQYQKDEPKNLIRDSNSFKFKARFLACKLQN